MERHFAQLELDGKVEKLGGHLTAVDAAVVFARFVKENRLKPAEAAASRAGCPEMVCVEVTPPLGAGDATSKPSAYANDAPPVPGQGGIKRRQNGEGTSALFALATRARGWSSQPAPDADAHRM